MIHVNGIDMHVEQAGGRLGSGGPLVVLCHGFPELSYSWRHQLPVLAEAGYHVVAPDQRGYGRTSRPEAIEDYDILHLTDDMLALLDVFGVEKAVFVGHDWGAAVVWTLALRAPSRVAGVAALSVPFPARGQLAPTDKLRRLFGEDSSFYMLYFQEPGPADEELGRDPATTMRRLLCMENVVEAVLSGEGTGFIDRLPEPSGLPDWLRQDELDHFAAEFGRTGFTGGLNWYRNLDRNWELTAQYAEAKIEVPALYICGADDPVRFMGRPERMADSVPGLRGEVYIEGAGHWVQQEKSAQVNTALLNFIKEVHR